MLQDHTARGRTGQLQPRCATTFSTPCACSYQSTIAVHNGIMTLSRAISNLRAKQDAMRDARDVMGV